jgi:hypothetical protein
MPHSLEYDQANEPCPYQKLHLPLKFLHLAETSAILLHHSDHSYYDILLRIYDHSLGSLSVSSIFDSAANYSCRRNPRAQAAACRPQSHGEAAATSSARSILLP